MATDIARARSTHSSRPCDRRSEARAVRLPRRRRGRRDAQRRAGRDGRPARPLPRAGRRRRRSPPPSSPTRTGTHERYVREWLNAQAAGGYVDYDGRPLQPPARARRRAHRRGQPGLPARVLRDRARLGARLAADHRGRPQRRRRRLARAQPPRPRGLRAVLPARLQREPRRLVAAGARRRRRAAGARRPRRRRRLRPRRLDDPDGRGVPALEFLGSDYHEDSIEAARRRAREAGVAARFEVAPAAGYSGDGYALVTMFDCLHDMGDPSARRATCAPRSRPTACG